LEASSVPLHQKNLPCRCDALRATVPVRCRPALDEDDGSVVMCMPADNDAARNVHANTSTMTLVTTKQRIEQDTPRRFDA
jgi:hypothetical protein